MLNTEGTQGFQEWQVYYFVRTSNPINGEGDEEANDRYFVTIMVEFIQDPGICEQRAKDH
ncbi:hypothetical protein ACS0TY_034137 [Phlomoides rotata]